MSRSSTARRPQKRLLRQPLALANRLIAYDAFQNNRLDEAGRCFEEVIALLRAHGDAWSIGILLTDLAGLRVFEGRLDEARTCATEAMSVLLALRDRRGLGWCLQTIAMLEAAAGRFHRAGWLYGAGEAMLHSIGAAGQLVVTQVQERYLAPVREALGDAAFQAAANEGRAASFAQVMDMAPAAFAAS